MNYNVGSATLGLNVSIGGYNDKLHVLAHHVLERVKTLEIKEERLKVMKEDVRTLLCPKFQRECTDYSCLLLFIA